MIVKIALRYTYYPICSMTELAEGWLARDGELYLLKIHRRAGCLAFITGYVILAKSNYICRVRLCQPCQPAPMLEGATMFQQLIIIGNLGNDPELRYTADGTPVASFSVAVNRRWTRDDGGSGEETTWFRVSAWRKQAEIVNQYLKKGRQVMVIGRVSARGYAGADGSPRASLDVTAETIKFIGGGGREESPFAEPSGEEEVFF